jgi:PKD repeat protein
LKFASKLLTIFFTLALFSTSASAQLYGFPKKGTNGACTGCREPNTDLPTYPYKDPIVAHVGRYMDSSTTTNHQNMGMRTVRAEEIRTVLSTGRVYIEMGEAIGSYKLDTFFTQTLKAPMSALNVLNTGHKYDRYNGAPLERIAVPDSFMYPESPRSGWETEYFDHQVNLGDLDADDRGYVYHGNLWFGWGIGRDTGVTGGSHMTFVSQVLLETPSAQVPQDNSGIPAESITSIKVGSKYYVVISSSNQNRRIVWDVTNPASPVKGAILSGKAFAVTSWTKHEQSQRIAIINSEKKLLIFNYDDYVAGRSPVATFQPRAGKSFSDASFDESGRLWVAEAQNRNSNKLWRLTPSGSGYTSDMLDVYGDDFSPIAIHAGGGYLAVGGKASGNPDNRYQEELRLFKIEGGTPRLVEHDNFFRKFYDHAPEGFADPSNGDIAYVGLADVQLIPYGGKTYLFYSANGLGDVYEIEAGEALSPNVVGSTFGTTNPHAKSTEAGPFYGDPIKFKATSNNANASYGVDWSFDNPEAGSGNRKSSGLGEQVTYQYTGIITPAGITQTKTVRAEASSDPTIFGEISVGLKTPKARLGVPGVTAAVVNNDVQYVVVPGDKFTDASDGSVESHYTIWDVDGERIARLPNEEHTVGPTLGLHNLTLISTYGPYDPTSMPTTVTAQQRFQAHVANVKYTTVPFTATINAPTSTTTKFNFTGTARYAQSVLSATQWTVTWTLLAPGASALASAQQVSQHPVGTIPPFAVDKGDLLNGSTVQLVVSVDPTAVTNPVYATALSTYGVTVPNPKIDVTGCTNVGEPCTLTANSLTSGTSTASWVLEWSVKQGNTPVSLGNATGKSVSFTPQTVGQYTATVTEKVFNVNATKNFSVAALACGPVADAHTVNLDTDCIGTCTAGTPVNFYINMLGYAQQPCDTYTWNFGDNTATATGIEPKHTYAKNGTYKVTMTMKNTSSGTNQRVWSLDVQVGSSGGGNPGPSCSSPVGISISWSGDKGCGPSKACGTDENVTFVAKRPGNAALLGCDTATWNLDGTTSTQKSPKKIFNTPGTKTITVVISNTEGTTLPVEETIQVVQATTPSQCNGSISSAQLLGIDFQGAQSGCQAGSSKPCQLNEDIMFNASILGYAVQACDRFEWNFDDGSAVVTTAEPTKKFTSQRNAYRVTLKIYNTNAPSGVVVTVDVPFSNVPIKPVPVLTRANFPAKGAKGSPVTFTATSDINATGWLWEFDGVANSSQLGQIGKTNSITHTFTTSGNHTVKVSARNAEDTATAPTNFTVATINIEDTPEYRYLLPAVAHIPGDGGSTWRTDVQIYNPDPNVSPQNPLVMTATLRDMNRTLEIFDSTYIYEDFMQRFTNGNDSGPVIITTKSQYPPQIWTRTYNLTSGGTYGQFVPAIRLDENGGGSAVGSGKYYVAGLRSNARYRTNVGIVNPTGSVVPVNVAIYDDLGIKVGQYTRQVNPFDLKQDLISSVVPGINPNRPFSIEFDVPAGQWVIAFASFLDNGSGDPVYMQAVRASELASPDFRQGVLPGVGRVGPWRSDVSIYNPNARTVTVDLAYHDASGAKKGEATNVPIRAGEFLQYDDILRQGVFGNVADGLGMLRVTVPSTVDADLFPMTFARTYNDGGNGKTYGQGIQGVAAARANVKPGKPALIAGVRNDAKYYTNIGMTNVTEIPTNVTIRVLNPSTGAEAASYQFALKAYESIVATNVNLGGHQNASIRFEVTGGNILGFASIIDKGTFDPEYVSATALQ